MRGDCDGGLLGRSGYDLGCSADNLQHIVDLMGQAAGHQGGDFQRQASGLLGQGRLRELDEVDEHLTGSGAAVEGGLSRPPRKPPLPLAEWGGDSAVAAPQPNSSPIRPH